MAFSRKNEEVNRLIENLAGSIQIDDLSERLGLHVRRAGSPSAQCVFHDDTNPSMRLYPGSKQGRSHYHCYVCNAHGDIFDLTKHVKNIDFIEAVRWLASQYGYQFPTRKNNTSINKAIIDLGKKADPSKVSYETALSIYKSKSGNNADSWLQKRSIPDSVRKSAEILYALPKTLTNSILEEKDNYGHFRSLTDQLESIGIIREQKFDSASEVNNFLDLGKSYRDFFYDGRIIFPIRNELNEIIGFAGRKVVEDSPSPKYLYTPGLPKSRILYRSYVAFEKVRADVRQGKSPVIYVCEGLLDALRLESLGFPAVAVLGASLSEEQANLLLRLASEFSGLQSLKVRIFMDMDWPGLGGAAEVVKRLLKWDSDFRLELSFVWPIITESGLKDPDEILKKFSKNEDAAEFLDAAVHPAALALVSDQLKTLPSDILNNDKWDSISFGVKYRLAFLIEKIARPNSSRILSVNGAKLTQQGKWSSDLNSYLHSSFKIGTRITHKQKNYLSLNLARELAESGANKGEVLSDIAAWRRISLGATAFNEGLISRLRQGSFLPIEPFDAVHVSRGFGKSEPRLKAMPCPEDLIAQQYLINELLSESLDNGSPNKFSNNIPAVRYYRSLNMSRTTGEGGCSEHEATLSFAYQVDMEVLEGEHPSKDGIFRPYFDCWKEFISSLLEQGKKMNHVHMVRLDLKRYYDRIKKSVVRDVLRNSVIPAYEELGSDDQEHNFIPIFRPRALDNEPHKAVIDFLLDQSFGFTYFNPENGESMQSNPEIGIPQGPILSAWLGNIVLFKMDAVFRKKLDELNINDSARAGYARYVDDIVILGDSSEVLDALRAVAEDVARLLQVEISPKESFAPMSVEEFSEKLMSGRALAVSGPREDIALLSSGDGDAGWGMWHIDRPQRQTSLELLRDPRLYSLPVEKIQDQVFTALRAEDLRPAELAKASRWLWYQAAKTLMGENYTAMRLFSCYWGAWKAACAQSPFLLDEKISWDDPALYALEGLEALLEHANDADYNSTLEETKTRLDSISKLACVVQGAEFASLFMTTDIIEAPLGWGAGVLQLSRIFFQRLICMRWKASKLFPHAQSPENSDFVYQQIYGRQNSLRASLNRSLITDAETWCKSFVPYSVNFNEKFESNPLSQAFIWLHRVIVALSVDHSQDDPLISFHEELDEIRRRLDRRQFEINTGVDKFIPLLFGLLESDESEVAKEYHLNSGLTILTLQTLASIARRDLLAQLLAKRKHLLQLDEEKIPLPPLPGIPAQGLLLVSTTKHDSQWDRLSKIWWVTANETTDDVQIGIPQFMVADPSHPATTINLSWKKDEKYELLSIHFAVWPDEYPSLISIDSKPFSPQPKNISWIADAFEAISRINKSGNFNVENMEYASAWSYLVVNKLPNDSKSDALALTLLTPLYSKETLDGFAFVRSGRRGLQIYDVLKEHAQYWRAGVLLSDLFGFRRDLDRYAELKSLEILNDDLVKSVSPAEHLLRNTLRKLRGTYIKNGKISFLQDAEHLPATLKRSLHILRDFPHEATYEEEVIYVLASEAETAAMYLRYSANFDLTFNGVAASYISQIALRVVNRIPLEWASAINDFKSAKNIPTNRTVPKIYFELSSNLRVLHKNNLKDSIKNIFKVLIGGLDVSAISVWVRDLVFAINALGDKKNWPFPKNGDVATFWSIEECGFIWDKPKEDVDFLVKHYEKLTSGNAAQHEFSCISPFGWLTLLAGQIGLFGEITKRDLHQVWSDKLKNDFNNAAKIISNTGNFSAIYGDDIAPDWPFEFGDNFIDDLSSGALWGFSESLNDVENNIALKVTNVSGDWRLNVNEANFTDIGGGCWDIKRWQIFISTGSKPARIKIDSRLLSLWDETRDKNGNLLFISASDERLRSLFYMAPSPVKNFEKSITPLEIEMDFPLDIVDGSKSLASNSEVLNTNQIIDSRSNVSGFIDGRGSLNQKSTIVNSWRTLQHGSWGNRRSRSAGHIRAAILQWDLIDTYHHPASETCNSSKVAERLNSTTDIFEDSCQESRRIKIIEEALIACEKFGVDILVLPEYSVRPDTVGWIKDYLKSHNLSTAVVAGTYKLHGNVNDIGFDKVHRNILGVTDYLKTFGSSTLDSSSEVSPHIYSSGEYSSILTLLAPLALKNGKRIVCTFSRRKKYPSLAAGEVFNPLLEEINPLFTTNSFLSDIEMVDENGDRANTVNEISARSFNDYLVKLKHLENFSEFICSELFLPMSPANYQSLAIELHKLATRFGALVTPDDAVKKVLADLAKISEFLGVASAENSEVKERDLKRRTILIIPAMTKRSADYWIFGQSSLLAGGITSIFCNAVSSIYSCGGSCFIGIDSWREQKVPLEDRITPYAGWSKGIFYNKKTDALGEKEQALVIADIDPQFMLAVKPRPQALAVPLQLVAYLPIVEEIPDSEFYMNMEVATVKLNGMGGKIAKPNVKALDELSEAISNALREKDNGSFMERYKHWKKYFRMNPVAGVPPAAVDWLWVGNEVEPVKIFVPPCGLDE